MYMFIVENIPGNYDACSFYKGIWTLKPRLAFAAKSWSRPTLNSGAVETDMSSDPRSHSHVA